MVAAIRPAFRLPADAQLPDLAASAGAADTAPASSGRANARMMRTRRDVMLLHLAWIDVRPLCVTGQVLQRFTIHLAAAGSRRAQAGPRPSTASPRRSLSVTMWTVHGLVDEHQAGSGLARATDGPRQRSPSPRALSTLRLGTASGERSLRGGQAGPPRLHLPPFPPH